MKERRDWAADEKIFGPETRLPCGAMVNGLSEGQRRAMMEEKN
jgi:hypothetical protein